MALPKEYAASGTAGQAPQRPRRRRPPSQTEQARREAWGHKWGGMIGAYWKQRAASGYTTGRTRGPAI